MDLDCIFAPRSPLLRAPIHHTRTRQSEQQCSICIAAHSIARTVQASNAVAAPPRCVGSCLLLRRSSLSTIWWSRCNPSSSGEVGAMRAFMTIKLRLNVKTILSERNSDLSNRDRLSYVSSMRSVPASDYEVHTLRRSKEHEHATEGAHNGCSSRQISPHRDVAP